MKYNSLNSGYLSVILLFLKLCNNCLKLVIAFLYSSNISEFNSSFIKSLELSNFALNILYLS